MGKKTDATLREVQGFWNSPILFWPVILISASAWITFILNITLFNNIDTPRDLSGYLLLLGILFPLLFFLVTFTIEVRTDGVYFRFFPFHIRYKKIPFKSIAYYYPVNYCTISRFGGIGIRFNSRGEKIYNLGGNKGVEYNRRKIGYRYESR
jgi:hypothetical protein